MRDRLSSFRGAAWLPLTLAWAFSPRIALAEDSKKAECASAYERSQELRVSGKLTKAEEALALCAQDACPAFVQTDCAQWLTEVKRDIPTLVFAVKDAKGEDTTAVRVSVDGEELLTELDGKAVEMDPGTHKFRFEMEGAEPVTQEVVVQKAEKDRVITVTFAPHEEVAAPADSPYGGVAKEPDKKEEPAAPADSGKAGPLRPFAFVAGGVGVAGVIGFIAFGAAGSSKQSDLDASCGATHTCAQSDVDSIKTKYLLADISLGVGIAGLGTGVALFFLSQPKGDPEAADASLVHWDVRPVRDGALGTVSGRF